MSTTETIVWYAAALLGMAGSALFSGLETGCYTINRVRLHARAHDPKSNAAVLERLIAQPNRLLGTLLVGNNMVNYLASMAVAALLTGAGYTDWMQVGVSALILTPLLFVFGEVLPKDLFRSYADVLAPPFARPLRWLGIVLTITGVLPIISLVSSGLRRKLGDTRESARTMHPHRFVSNMMRESASEGVITVYQSNMIDRVLATRKTPVADVMIPWKKATSVRTNQPAEALWALADRVPYARVPALDTTGEPVGVIDLTDALRYDPADCPPLDTLVEPAAEVSSDTNLREALQHLQRARVPVAFVVDDAGKPVGLVTAKDLVEPIVGDLDVW